jgi:prepilin-type N-terminal cleavage/methylation domain-containing protein
MTATAATGLAHPRSDAPSRAGFTLLEVLVALAVLGLILGALAAGLRFGREALRTQARDTEAGNELAPVDTILRSLIERAWPDAGGAEARFQGAARTLSFRTTMPLSLTKTRIRDADVAIGVDTAHRLYLTWLPWYRHWIVPLPAPERIELLANVDHVEFDYWDPSLHLPPGGWVTAWIGTSAPKLLRVRLVFVKGSGLRWPDIIVGTARNSWTF